MTSDRKMKSLMGGAALAALLILPSMSGHASETRHHATPPAAPAAPEATAQPAPPAPPQTGDWVRWPVKSYNAGSLKVEDLVGTLTIDIRRIAAR